MNPLEWSWITKTVISTISVIFAWLAIGFFQHHYQIRIEVISLWYFALTNWGMWLALWGLNLVPRQDLIPPLVPLLLISLTGLVLGSITTILLFSAVADAPNAGLALSIHNTSSAFVALAMVFLAAKFPQYFPVSKMDLAQFGGIILILIGVALVIKIR